MKPSFFEKIGGIEGTIGWAFVLIAVYAMFFAPRGMADPKDVVDTSRSPVLQEVIVPHGYKTIVVPE